MKRQLIGILLIIIVVLIGVYYYYFMSNDFMSDNIEDNNTDTAPVDINDLKDLKDSDYSDDPEETEEIQTSPAFVSTTTGNIEMEKIWDDSGSGADTDLSFWRPSGYPMHTSVGDIAINSSDKIPDSIRVLFVNNSEEFSKLPVDYKQVWNTDNIKSKDQTAIWEAICPDKYKSIGHIASEQKPLQDTVRCVHEDYLSETTMQNKLWRSKTADSKKSGKNIDITNVWGSTTFLAVPSNGNVTPFKFK